MKRQKISACGGDLIVDKEGDLVKFTRVGLCPLIVSSLADVRSTDQDELRARLHRLRVKTILSVTQESLLRPIAELYASLNITYINHAIDETVALKGSFFDLIGSEYNSHLLRSSRNDAFLVHCFAGVNRSGIAMATLLWLTAPDEDSVENIIACMRESRKEFIARPAFIGALQIWTGEVPSKRVSWAGDGKLMRASILEQLK